MQQRSTKGASKQRREQINAEIVKIRDQLPVSENIRNHLSQLQVMSFCCTYVAKCNFFENAVSLGNSSLSDIASALQLPEFSELLPGFLMMVTVEGKVLYLSDNVLEYLGHSMVDILTHIDTIYDLIENSDHKMVKDVLDSVKSGVHLQDEWSFVCRMGLAKKLHQSLGLSDQKIIQVQGCFKLPQFCPDFQNPVFVAFCRPRLNASIASDNSVVFNTMIYESLHSLDMKYLDISRNGEVHLGYGRSEIRCRSWYDFIHPDDIHKAMTAHKNLMYCESESRSPLFVRIQTKDGAILWLCIMLSRIKIPHGEVSEAVVCINQVLKDQDVMHEYESGSWRSRFPSYGQDFQQNFLSTEGPFSKTGSGFEAGKCSSSREEVLRRLKRKMEMKEVQRKRSLMSSSLSSTSSISPSPNSQGKSTTFNFDSAAVAKTIARDGSNGSFLLKDQCGSTSDVEHSSSSSGSVFHSNSPLPPGAHPFSLSVLCPKDEGNTLVTSMPTPKFGMDHFPSGVGSVGSALSEEEEVVNIVEKIMEGKAFREDSKITSVKAYREATEEKLASELPVLCPSSIDHFFREFVPAPSNYHNSLNSIYEFTEMDTRSLASFGMHGCISAEEVDAEFQYMSRHHAVQNPVHDGGILAHLGWRSGLAMAIEQNGSLREDQFPFNDCYFECDDSFQMVDHHSQVSWHGGMNAMSTELMQLI